MISYQSVHFVGVLAPEMASLAFFSVALGIQVSGSHDVSQSIYLDELKKAGVTFYDMYAQVNIGKSVDLIVISHYYDLRHVEAEAGLKLKIPVMSETDYAKLVSEDCRRLAILGDYEAKIVASFLAHTWQNARVPVRGLTSTITSAHEEISLAVAEESDWFMLPLTGFKRDATTYEADFLSYEAEIAMIPSILYDYPELNTTLDDVYQSFYAFAKRVPRKGLIIGNSDYARMKRLHVHLVDRHIETYGFDRDAKWQIREVTVENGKTEFFLIHDRRRLGPFIIPFVGDRFVYAAAAVCIISMIMELRPEIVYRGLATLPQYSRFNDIKHGKEGRLLIDDQADHPAVIEDLLSTIRTQYPEKKIWCLYQPGSYLRTKALFSELEKALSIADFVYLADIKGYPKEKSEGLHIRHLIGEMKRTHPQTYYFDSASEMSHLLADRVASTDCIVSCGVEGVCQEILSSLLPQVA
jgi:UDP-N-acetylmuramate--alanine ligase